MFIQKGEPLLIDMDRLSFGDPIAEISDLYYFYVALGEDDPDVVRNFMGFSYDVSKHFFDVFLKEYLGDDYEKMHDEVIEKAELICNIRMINKLHKKKELTVADRVIIDRCMGKIAAFFLQSCSRQLQNCKY